MEKIQIIRNLEALFQVCFSKEQNFLRAGSEQNDARVTFHKHLINTINSGIHLMIFSDTTLSTEDWWTKKLSKYKINKRIFSTSPQESRQIEKGYIDQYLVFSYFNFVFVFKPSNTRFSSFGQYLVRYPGRFSCCFFLCQHTQYGIYAGIVQVRIHFTGYSFGGDSKICFWSYSCNLRIQSV